MRISDWSSDVCSSDLCHPAADLVDLVPQVTDVDAEHRAVAVHQRQRVEERHAERGRQQLQRTGQTRFGGAGNAEHAEAAGTAQRSEEHTSELQSLMRNSYAVSCLKTKTKKKSIVAAHSKP